MAADDPTGGTPNEDTEIKAADFAEMQRQTVNSGAPSLEQLTDVKFEAEAILGRSILSVGEILELGAGSVVELNRQIAEPIDLVIQGVKVATGEVVVVDDCFAIRIKEIVRPEK
jgi:flagellar motor switch protein FliN